jgi:hypothetical protein
MEYAGGAGGHEYEGGIGAVRRRLALDHVHL